MLSQPKDGMCSCHPCARDGVGKSDLQMTYAGFGLEDDPAYTEIVSPNGDYTVVWDGVRHWSGTPILLGTYDTGGEILDIYFTPMARCVGEDGYNHGGMDATLGFNYTTSPLGTPMTGTGTDPIFTPGTLTITLAS